MQPPPPDSGYTVPTPGAPSGQKDTPGTLALIFGIASIPLAACFLLGALVGVVSLVLGILGVIRADRGLASNGRVALAGAICGFLGMILTLIAASFGIGHP